MGIESATSRNVIDIDVAVAHVNFVVGIVASNVVSNVVSNGVNICFDKLSSPQS